MDWEGEQEVLQTGLKQAYQEVDLVYDTEREFPHRKLHIDWEKEVDVPMYHGTRQHMTPEEIKKKGIKTWAVTGDAEEAIMEARKHFGLGDIPSYPKKGYSAGLMLNDARDPKRMQISSTIIPEAPVWWSMSAPELVHLSLDYARIPRKEMTKYLDQKYGKRYRLKLSKKPTKDMVHGNPADIHTGWKDIPPEYIQEVEELPDQIIKDKYIGKGWIKLSGVPEDDQKIIRFLQKEYKSSLDYWGLKFKKLGKSSEYFRFEE